MMILNKVNTWNKCFLFSLCFIVSIIGNAQTPFQGKEYLFTRPHSYIIYRTIDAIKVDGEANEASWQNTPWSEYFIDIEGNVKPRPPVNTRFKMLWDQHNLYVHAELEEPHIWGTLKTRDEIVYNDNDFEIFIDPDGDTHQYFEIEVNVLNTIFDLYMDKPYRNRGIADIKWDAAGLQSGIAIEGTLNNPDDTDKKWTVEMAIPFTSLRKDKSTPVPENNTVWRMNFSRVQWDREIVNNQYQRKRDANNKLLAENNYVWSEQGVINMHFPERWGYVVFSKQPAGPTSAIYTIPFSENAKQYLWLVYYKQKDFFAEHKRYASSLTQLGFPSDVIPIENQLCKISMETSEKEFSATILCKKRKEQWKITYAGQVTKGK